MRNRWFLVVAAGLSVFMVALDSSIVNVALPTLSADFHVDAAGLQWVVEAYLLVLVALGLPIGRWVDGFGRREAAMAAVLGFAGASALCGLAPGLAWVVGARVLQGVFGAMIAAVVVPLAAGSVAIDARGRALGVVATLGPLGAAAGPALGGLLVAVLGWRAIFFVNIPVCLAVSAIVLHELEAGPLPRWPDLGWSLEAALLGGGALALFLGLSLAESTSIIWLGLLAVAVPLVAGWARLSSTAPVRVMMGNPQVAVPLLALTLLPAAASTVGYLAPFFLARQLHVGPEVTGFTVLAFPLTMGATGFFGGFLADRFRARVVATIGTGIFIVGLAALAPFDPRWTPVELALRLALLGLGLGLFAGPNQSAMLAALPQTVMATAGAAAGLARSLGFALGPALATASWAGLSYAMAGMRVAVLGAVIAALLALAGQVVQVRRPLKLLDPAGAPHAVTADPDVGRRAA